MRSSCPTINNRRQPGSVRACVAAAVLLTVPAVYSAIESHDGGPPVPVIDMHTHVFNGHDLPLAGILNARGVPLGVSNALAKVLNATTAKDDLDGPMPQAIPPGFNKSVDETRLATSSSLLKNAQANLAAPEATSLFSVLSKEEQDELKEYAGKSGPAEKPDPTVSKALSEMSQTSQELEVLALALEKAGFPPGESDVPTTMKSASDVNRGGYLAFLGVMTEGNLHIAWGLQKYQYPGVDLFVHHMMDLEKAYDTKPVVPFEQQIYRMTKLDRRFDGKFVHFVAFDPFRRNDALETVKRGLDAGAIGVKFYPPSGYRASGNTIPADPAKPSFLEPGSRSRWLSRYDGVSASQLDALNDELFAYCEKEDIPIFTHCTPMGFEADKNYGLMADPKYWKPVLEKHKKLRLCFGHSGGHAFWFPNGPETAESKFGSRVVDLCLEYPNVFCEVAYLEQILDAASRELFKKRLKEQIIRSSNTGGWKLGDKIMYGSDWHMIHKEKGHENYPAAFNELFADAVLQPWQRSFFCRNAITFLKLRELVTKPALSPNQKEYVKQLLSNADAGPKP